ncbi:hypothetical protein PF004_g24524 [Phytophthora fragariae]|nr:hypothetical protein PF003_g31079 [Phytophthora fragariae]KAE8923468.1 hypothetical protein PF009_g26282 [Phytophthora fragariae]KAE9181482.1 hypothetical protein PF004_g24524 [Phytophthora fragariae]
MIGYLMGKIPLFRRANFGQANYNFIRAGEDKRRRNYQDFSRENMRLHPSTAFIMREAMETTTLVDGTTRLRKMSLSYQRQQKLWKTEPKLENSLLVISTGILS